MTETDHFDGGMATLAADSVDGTPFTVSGVALPVNTVVNGGQNTDHFYDEATLKDAADLLEGQQIVKNFHEIDGQANADQVIGEITSAGFEQGVGLVFEGEIADPEIAEKVAHGYLDVSPTVARQLGEFDDSMGAQQVDRVTGFRDLAVVANGQPGAAIDIGANPAIEALAMDALSKSWDTLETHKEVAGVRFRGTADGKLDESAIDPEETDLSDHYLYGEGEDKEDFSYPVVDADGMLRKGNVESAWSLGCRGQCPGADTHESRLMDLADEFDDPPEFAEETDTNSDEGEGEGDDETPDPKPLLAGQDDGETVRLISG